MVRRISADSCGTDIVSKGQKKDGHIRYEPSSDEGAPWAIVVDVFDSRIKSPVKAHLGSRVFENSRRGLEDGTVYLKSQGFDIALKRAKINWKCALIKHQGSAVFI